MGGWHSDSNPYGNKYVRNCNGPLATALCKRFSTKSVVMAGGICFGIGGCLSAIAPNTVFLFFSFSFLTGFGGSLCYAPGIVMVGQYFNKYVSIAMGLGCAGSGLGVFCVPPFLEYLFGKYGFFGAMLIMGGIMFNNCVSGALYRSPTQATRLRTKPNDHDSLEGIEDVVEKTEEKLANKKSHLLKTLGEEMTKSSRSLVDSLTGSPQLNRNNQQNINSHSAKPDPDEQNSLSTKFPQNDVNIAKQHHDTVGPCHYDMSKVYKYLDLRLFHNPTFILYSLCMTLVTLSYISGTMLLTPYAIEQGITKQKAIWLLSVVGISDTIGRVSSGFFFNIPSVKRHRRHLYITSILMSGLTQMFWAFCRSFSSFVVVIIGHGFFNGVVVSQRAVLCIDLMGIENLSSAFGLTIFMQGIGVFVGPLIAGLCADVSGTYFYSFIFTSMSALAAGGLLFLEWLFIARKEYTKDQERGAKKSDVKV